MAKRNFLSFLHGHLGFLIHQADVMLSNIEFFLHCYRRIPIFMIASEIVYPPLCALLMEEPRGQQEGNCHGPNSRLAFRNR